MITIDLFAGLGGFSEGARLAGCRVVWAANHWYLACAIHEANHPKARHVCQDLHQAQWEQIPDCDLMLASPQCTGHSRARGTNKPRHEKDRATAWAVVAAAEVKRPPIIVVENVPEFLSWELFIKWRECLELLGYTCSLHTLDAADFGVPQHRVRVFLVFTLSKAPLSLSFDKVEHVGAESFVDFDDGIWTEIDKQGRAENTKVRVEHGRKVYGERFLIAYYGNTKVGRPLSRPIGTLTTRDRYAVIDGKYMRMLSVRECLVGTGFRADYVLPSSHVDSMRLIGNSVSPLVAMRLIEAIKKAA